MITSILFTLDRKRRNRNRNRKKTKPSDPYDYDYDALTTTITSTIFDSHRVLTLLTTRITIAITITTLV